ncbi:MAG TPA: phosphotransferase family protein, partial [Phenylobacterium sp.]
MSNEVREALEGLAGQLGGEGARVSDLQRLSGGASMETWAFAVESPTGREEMVLRRRSAPMDPEASRSVSLATEAALIRAAGAR